MTGQASEGRVKGGIKHMAWAKLTGSTLVVRCAHVAMDVGGCSSGVWPCFPRISMVIGRLGS